MPAAAPKDSFLRRATFLSRQAFNEWSGHYAPRLAAALAYYAVLSAAPLLVLSVALADLVVGQKAADGQLAWEMQNLVGDEAAKAIQAAIQGAHKPSAGAIATVLSIITLIVGGSSVIVELHDALNFIWGVRPAKATNWRAALVHLIRERFFSFFIVIGAGCLLFVSLVLSAGIAAIGEFFGPVLPAPEWALHWAAFVASFLIVTLLFGAVYKYIPDVRLTWTDVAIGAAVTSLLFTIGKQLIALYLGRVGFESTYGAAWALVLLLVWVYYSAQLFFLGAEFTKVYARRYGSHRASEHVTSEADQTVK